MAKLLLEIFSEEIPARMQPRAAEELKRLVLERLDAARLTHDAANAYVTPRRLTLIVAGLPKAQPDITVEKKGPRVGAPQAAIDGFLRSVGLASLDQCEQRDTGKGVFYYAVSHEKGRPTEEALGGLLADALDALLWPKSMRWGRHRLRWVRPIHSILCQFNGETIPFQFAHLTAGDSTCGHRHLAPERFAVAGVSDYRAKLKAAHVVLDAEARTASIRHQLDSLAAAEGLRVAPDEALVAENGGLVEWPVVLFGRIDEAFLDVPREVLTTAMRTHQKYFSLERADGAFAPRFALVSNMVTADDGAAIVAGNERVLRARLSDAKFFWDQDRAHTLESRVPRLADIVFHAKLGTVAEKVRRIGDLAGELSAYVPGADAGHARRAALLCKADLTTNMVGEFPELQGIMGRYYASHDGEAEPVAAAIAEHYSPLGPNDRCPSRPESVVVSLADKLDTLVGFFTIGETPTGSKDPYALRRAALGVIRLVLENKLRLPLLHAFERASLFLAMNEAGVAGADRNMRVALLGFFADRLKVHLRERGIGHDLINAIFAERGEALEDDLFRLTEKAHRLAAFLKSDDGANLLVAYRRANNIVRAEQKKGWVANGSAVDRALFREPEEHALFEALGKVRGIDLGVVEAGAFEGYLQDLAGLRRPVDAFFDKVTVNAEDAALRDNRLKFMQAIGAKMDAVADFSKIEG
ncbi:MAG: glycine--tRNA ligase subunit beta [Alphaproteobacteria bacterium]